VEEAGKPPPLRAGQLPRISKMSPDQTSRNWRQRVIPLLIDLATLAGYLFLVPWLGERIIAQHPSNHFLLAPGFLLILVGMLAIRQLPKNSMRKNELPSFFGVCLVFFLLVVYSLLYSYATNLGGSETDNDGMAVILVFIMLVPTIGSFYLRVTAAQPDTRKALVTESVALFSVNYLTLIGAAVWDQFTSLPSGKDPVHATGIAFLILYGILYLLFLAFFGLPRLYLLRATGDKVGLAIYLLGLAIYLWDKVPPVN
jgi:hypothetical protein